jgi:uroporphyrinogen-III synthase
MQSSSPPPAPARPLRLWVTRAEPAASRTAERLRAAGHAPLVAPVLAIRELPAGDVEAALEGVAALAFTSAQGVESFAARTPARDLPVFAVGDATAEAARARGWRRVRSADGDGAALARLIAGEVEGGGCVLSPGARRRAFDLEAALRGAGVRVRDLPVYETQPLPTLPPEAAAALEARAVDAVLLHSPAAARALGARLADAPRLAAGLADRPVFALSAACAEALPAGLGGARRVAPAPREADLLALLA